jgi:hypothetical protein
MGYNGVVAYADERKAEISTILAFNGVDCFHDGQKALEAVHTSHEISRGSFRRRDFITDKVISMVEDMLVSTDGRLDAHLLWSKQSRILEKARREIASPVSPTTLESNIPFPSRPAPQTHHTLPVPGLSAGPRRPPVLPPEVRQESTTRPARHQSQRNSRGPPNVQLYEGNTTVLDDVEGGFRRSPDSLTEAGEGNIPPSPSSRISSSHPDSQPGSPIPSPSKQPPYPQPDHPRHNQPIMEDAGEGQFDSTATINRQGSLNRPRGTPRMSAFSNPRSSMSAGTTPQSVDNNSRREQQRLSFPIRQGLNSNSMNILSPQLPVQSQQYQHQHQPQRGLQPAVSQPAHSRYMTLQEGLDWRMKCKYTKTHAPGLNELLFERLKDRDHVSLMSLHL